MGRPRRELGTVLKQFTQPAEGAAPDASGRS
jgi:hypothetical protein